MRKIHFAGLMFVLALALCAVAATSAFAVEELPVWLVNQKTITEPIAVKSETDGLAILLEDMGLKVDILVGATNEGQLGETVGGVFNPMLDLISKITINSTEKDEGAACGTLNKVAPVHLPWLTELVLSGGIIVDILLEDAGEAGTGKPGWEVECTTLGVKVKDVCELTEGKVEIKNVAGEEEVESIFKEPPTEPAECKGPIGAGEGLLEGINLILPVNAALKIAASDVVE